MKFVRTGAVLLTLAEIASGCGTSAINSQPSRPPAGATADLLRVPSLPSEQLTATHLDRTVVKPPGTADLSPPPSAARGTVGSVGPWSLSLKSKNGQYLVIGTSTSGCSRLWRLGVELTSRSVVITPQLVSPSDIPSCPPVTIGHLWLVDLDSPLGSRSLLHPKVTGAQQRTSIGVGVASG
jgi:hypothetical protein